MNEYGFKIDILVAPPAACHCLGFLFFVFFFLLSFDLVSSYDRAPNIFIVSREESFWKILSINFNISCLK